MADAIRIIFTGEENRCVCPDAKSNVYVDPVPLVQQVQAKCFTGACPWLF